MPSEILDPIKYISEAVVVAKQWDPGSWSILHSFATTGTLPEGESVLRNLRYECDQIAGAAVSSEEVDEVDALRHFLVSLVILRESIKKQASQQAKRNVA